MNFRTAVVAGTPVDTAMGAAYLRRQDPSIEIMECPTADTPREQTRFQLSGEAEKRRKLESLFSLAQAEGIRDFFIYCNSLSGAFDFESLAAERGVRVVTPLQIYRDLGRRYSRLAVLAANNQSTAAIERSLLQGNPDADVLGLGMLPLVSAVEAGRPPEAIVEDFHLAELAAFFRRNGAECLILGCTHFPWFREALERRSALPLLDPADWMYARLRRDAGPG